MSSSLKISHMRYLFILCLLGNLSAEVLKVPAEQVDELYALKNSEGVATELLTYSKTKAQLSVFQFDGLNKKVEKAGEVGSDIAPQHALSSDGAIIVVTGETLKKQGESVRVTAYSRDLSSQEVIFQAQTERAEVSSFKHIPQGLLMTYYDSVYFTVTGRLIKGDDGKWTFRKLFRLRMATTSDTDGNDFLVARGYGDKIGEVGDATLVRGGKEIKLPTHNGVSSGCLAQLDEDEELEVVLGDGWHMNYGKLAEPRVSVFNYNPDKGEYEVEVVSNEKVGKQFRIDKITITNTGLILTEGREKSYLFDPKNNFRKLVAPSAKIVDLGNNYFSYLDEGVKIESITF